MPARNSAGLVFAMKKTLIFDECEWILTDEARNDKYLNPTDKNVLAVLQYMFDEKTPFPDGFYSIVLRDANKAAYTLEGTLKEWGFRISERTISRSINKLWRLGYLEYKRGFWNNRTHSGQPPRIRILKGTVVISNSGTDDYSDIVRSNNSGSPEKTSEKLSTGITGSYSDIVCSKNKEQEKENRIMEEVVVSDGYLDSLL